jgi:STE24 endopeptidase
MYFVVLAGLALGVFSYGLVVKPGDWLTASLGTAAMMLLPGGGAALFMMYCRRVSRHSAQPADGKGRWSLSHLYPRATQAVQVLMLASYGGSLYLFGWAGLPQALGVADWGLPSGALIAAPFVIGIALAWIPLHYAEVSVRGTGPTLGERLSFNIRQYILTLCVPMGLVLGAIDAASMLPGGVRNFFENPIAGLAAGAAAGIVGFTLAPLVLVRIWKTSRLGDTPMRSRLAGLCERIGVAIRDIRVWETPGLYFLNAAVMGVIGRMRYILVSRTLLEVMPPEEVEAVFAHELGHAKRHHLAYYLVFAGNFVILANLFDTLTGAPDLWPSTAYLVTSVGAFALYWGLAFGYVSRTFEREADLFGADTVASVGLFTNGLVMIAHMNGMNPAARSWRHGSIRSRVLFLEAAESSPEVRARFMYKARFVRAFLVAAAVASAAATYIAHQLM